MSSLFTRFVAVIAFLATGFGANAQSISTNLNNRANVHTNVEEDFTVALNAGASTGTQVKLKITLDDPAQASAIQLSLADPISGTYSPLVFDGSGISESDPAPFFTVTLNAKVTFTAAGVYNYSVSVINASGNAVLANSDESVTVTDVLADPSIASDLDGQTIFTGDPTPYSVSTTPGGYAGTNVKVLFKAMDPAQVSHYAVEYFETANSTWIALPLSPAGEIDFGPAAGFPLAAATTQFRVTLDDAGTYNYTFSLYRVSDSQVLATADESVTVRDRQAPTVASNLDGQTVLVDALTEYSISTTPGDYAGTHVKVRFTALDLGQVSHYDIEYFETANSTWIALPLSPAGEIDFGPAAGFPLASAGTQFRVTFDAAGTYNYKLSLYRVSDDEVLATGEESVTVEELVVEDPEISSDLNNRSGVRINQDVNFRVNTTQNDAGSVNVRIRFTLLDPSRANDINLRFENPLTGSTETVTFDAAGIGFAGAVSGFALTDADYDFKAEFFTGGAYAYRLALVEAGSNNLLAESDEQVSVLDNSGIAENAAATVKVFPNPTADKLQIETGAEGTGSLEVFTLTGQTVLSQTVNGPVNTVSLAQLPAGVYSVRIRQNGTASVVRVVKN